MFFSNVRVLYTVSAYVYAPRTAPRGALHVRAKLGKVVLACGSEGPGTPALYGKDTPDTKLLLTSLQFLFVPPKKKHLMLATWKRDSPFLFGNLTQRERGKNVGK